MCIALNEGGSLCKAGPEGSTNQHRFQISTEICVLRALRS
jgi:hypothetical protein